MENRETTQRPSALLSTLALAALLLLPLAACGGDATDSATTEGTATASDAATETTADEVQHYEVQGQITGLPDDADPQANLTIRHEAIDDFVSMNGEVVGMSSMSMPFPVADDVDLSERQVGDKVSFTLSVDWDGDPAYQVTRLEPLPADTELEYRKARPAGDSGAHMDHEGMDHEGMDHEAMDHEGHEGMDHEGMDHGDTTAGS